MNVKAKAPTILLVLLIVWGVFSVRQIMADRQQIKLLQRTPQQLAKEEVQGLVGKMSKLVVLPEGEEPTLATVADKEKLKSQPAFAKAENGDKILIYVGARKAYIYSPSKNKIVDVVAVNIESSAQPVRVALYNGSTNPGGMDVLEKRLKDENIVGIQVVSKDSAKKTDYPKTEVIDLSGEFTDRAKQLANLLNGEVGSLPKGETPPKADILVIIGADFR